MNLTPNAGMNDRHGLQGMADSMDGGMCVGAVQGGRRGATIGRWDKRSRRPKAALDATIKIVILSGAIR